MKIILKSAALCALMAPAIAAAAPNFTTSVTVAYDPTQPNCCGPVYASASNNSSYVVRTGEDASNLYVDVTSTPNANTDTSLQFSNIYLGGLTFSGLIFEVTNDRVSTFDDPGTYYSLAGTGFTYNQATNDISFALPFAFLESDPLGIGFSKVNPGDQLRVSYSQSFGYSLVYGGYYDQINRLGAQIVPAAAGVPEPASWAMMVAGFGLVGSAVRRTRRTAVFA